MTDIYHETLARRMGFKPYAELSPENHVSIWDYCNKYYDIESFLITEYWYKKSTMGDNNWISYDVQPHKRIAAPHLRSK